MSSFKVSLFVQFVQSWQQRRIVYLVWLRNFKKRKSLLFLFWLKCLVEHFTFWNNHKLRVYLNVHPPWQHEEDNNGIIYSMLHNNRQRSKSSQRQQHNQRRSLQVKKYVWVTSSEVEFTSDHRRSPDCDGRITVTWCGQLWSLQMCVITCHYPVRACCSLWTVHQSVCIH